MAEFKPMVKMYTDEPKVILKLKKGGKVHSKHHHGHGHHSMHHATGGMTHGVKEAFHAEAGKSPKKPSMSARRKAMNPQLYKKGGKVAHKMDGGMMGAAPAAAAPAAMANPAMARAALMAMSPQQRMARAVAARKMLSQLQGQQQAAGQQSMPMAKKGGSIAKHVKALEKELHHHEKLDMAHAHHHKKGGHHKVHHKASGGAIDKAETRTTIEKGANKFAKTKVDDGQHHDKAHGTGEVKEGVPAGYKHGGHAHHKHGGKVHHLSGHPEGSHEHHKHMAKHHAHLAKGGSAHHKKMHEHHKHQAKMCKGGHYAVGGTIEGNEKKFENTYVVDGDHNDSAHGTGGVKMANAGGFKHGGKAHHHMKHHKHGGKHHFAKGGKVPGLSSATVEGGNWENRPANTAKPGVKGTKTGEVHESNAGGFKRGGHASKKAYATGGNVVDDGKAEKMPRRVKHPPVANSLQSGTYRKGGNVKKYAPGNSVTSDDNDQKPVVLGQYDPMTDRMNRAYKASEDNDTAENIADREAMMNLPSRLMGVGSRLYNSAKNLLSSSPKQGSVTKTVKSVTVSPPPSDAQKQKKGGKVRRKQVGGWC
jgi:hypothetical protein